MTQDGYVDDISMSDAINKAAGLKRAYISMAGKAPEYLAEVLAFGEIVIDAGPLGNVVADGGSQGTTVLDAFRAIDEALVARPDDHMFIEKLTRVTDDHYWAFMGS